ncbi:hypothetical protein FOCC_FOCC011891 [Frankliniella occidentalis]|nr:hypothetical protein FOCC_FOCC011891 [Frankliniella occidentalis]
MVNAQGKFVDMPAPSNTNDNGPSPTKKNQEQIDGRCVFLLNILLLKEGVEVNVHGQQNTCLVKGILICGTCDAPAKAAFLNLKTYAGYESCPKCLIVGEKSDESDDVMVFPHEEILLMRSKENYTQHLAEVMLKKDAVAGVKGPTILNSMLSNFMFDSTAIDSLHCLYLGITKQIFRLLFDKAFKGEPFSLHKFSDKVNSRLLAMNLPHYVHCAEGHFTCRQVIFMERLFVSQCFFPHDVTRSKGNYV